MSKGGWTRRGALFGVAAGAAACSPKVEAPPYNGSATFAHGVASGDPGPDRVIIWTRVTAQQTGPVPVRWVVARNRELTDIVFTGVAQADETRDYTVKVDVEQLRPGAPYFYGFLVGDQKSPVGKTRTLPEGRLDRVKIAVASCASYPHGFFNAYEAIGRRDDIDLVLHLGDYIYEYGVNGYGGDVGVSLGRVPSPQVECLSLSDYRLRHAQAKAEQELQMAHACAPWVVVWDDHEVANDSWSGGAENHQPNEGDWNDRKRAALQAYYEWMPIREPQAGRAFEAINRSFQFGDLFTLCMLETRLLGRSKQFETEIPLIMQAWDFSDPAAPKPLPAGASGPNVRMLPAPFEDVGGEFRQVSDWRRVAAVADNPARPPNGMHFMPDLPRLNAILSAPERTMMGAAQEQWLEQTLAASRAQGVTWRVLGNQVVMAQVLWPDFSRTSGLVMMLLERMHPGVGEIFARSRYPMPLNLDQWDGYPAARARLYEMFRRVGGSTLVLSGDSHIAWANELSDARGRVGVEFAGTSITSPNDAEKLKPVGIDFAAGVRARNPDLKWVDVMHRGFLLLTLTHEQALAEYFTVSNVRSKDYKVERAAAFTVAPGEQAVGPITPAA
ncbi:MAG TPA: alkaline phosphatase D family protein [Caulobacterales bacterium]|nr:alkaline phosphatase D family protein [Caulobacterales bacterium]